MTARVKVPGRGWAYTGVILGGLVSIAANVAHSFIPPLGARTSWEPEPGAVVGAVVWPVFLFVAVEIFARVRWPHGIAWRLVRWVGLLPVAGLAALVSYRHLSGLLAHYGEEPIIYYVGPLAVDGLMVMATGALLATGRYRHHSAPDTPVHELVPVSAAAPAAPIGGAAVAPSRPPSLVDAAKPEPSSPTSSPAPTVTPAVLAQKVTARPTAAPATSAAVSRPGTSTATRPKPSNKATPPAPRPAPSPTDISVTARDRARPTTPVVEPELLARVRAEAEKYRTEHGSPITPGQLAVRLRMTSEQAQQALAVLNLAPDSPTAPTTTVNGQPAKATR
jgi:hypothetical protein